MMRHITLISAHVAGERLPTSSPALPPPPCNRPPPRSCDTFVALPPATADGSVVFGKNSDRECEEVQEVVAIGGSQHPEGAQLRCTYITIPQAPATLAVVLSKPSWMWGAEMGANEAGVVCGNEAVWTVEDSEGPRALLGMDLVRLGLERGATAAQAVDVITELLERHGQGGPCEEAGTWTYHNSFLLADPSEAWVLETAGKCWAARRIMQGVFNISNCLSIRTVFDRCSQGLQAYAQQKGLWDGQSEFDVAAAFSDGGAPPLGELTAGREANGHRLLQASAGKLDPPAMMAILRDSSSGICMCDGGFRSNGSQVSRLARSTGGGSDSSAGQQHQHWFTATPDPQRSVYKPFAFPPASSSSGGSLRQQQPECSPHTAASPAARNPPHPLWQAWQAMHEYFGTLLPPQASLQLQELEAQGLDPQADLTFAVAVQREMQLYGAAV